VETDRVDLFNIESRDGSTTKQSSCQGVSPWPVIQIEARMKCPKCKSVKVYKLDKMYKNYGDYQCDDCLHTFKKKGKVKAYGKCGLVFGQEL